MSSDDLNTKLISKPSKVLTGRELIERNRLTKWTYDVLINEMDKWAYARGMFFFALMAFFLGNNINIYLWLFILITAYVLTYRAIRWWVDRYLMYMMEFCYFGISLLIMFIVIFPQNKEMRLTTYIYASGVMGNSVIIFGNQAQFANTDLITSS